MPANLENSAVAPGMEKVSFHFSAKEGSNYCITVLISHASKVMLKISQVSFNSIWTENFQMYKLSFEEA